MKQMKHVLSCILVLVLMVASVSALTAFAAGEATLILDSAQVEKGGRADLELNIEGLEANGLGITTLNISLVYDTNTLTFDSAKKYCKNGEIFGNMQVGDQQATGRNVVFFNLDGDSDWDDLVAKFSFVVAEDAKPGDYEIEIIVRQAGNWDKELVPVTAVNGVITVLGDPEPTTATVGATAAEGGEVTGAGTYDIGAEATLTATPDTGYKFVGWYDGETKVSENATFTFTVAADCAYTAKFEKIEYTVDVTVDPTEGGTATGAGTVEHGTEVTLTATANTGYKFAGWFNGETKVSENATFTFTAEADCAYTAKFEKIEYAVNVTVDPTEGGTVAGGATGEYEIGTNLILTATANSGYKFVGWYKDGELVEEEILYSFTVEADCEIVAKFEALVYYNVTVGATEGGNVSGSNTVLAGNPVTVIATPDAGYNFLGWYVNGVEVSTDETYTFTPEADIELEARFEKKPVPVTGLDTVVESESGETVPGVTVSTDKSGYQMGEAFTATVHVDNDKYMFIGWYQDGIFRSADLEYTDIYFEGIELTAKVVKKPENNGFAYIFGYTDTEMGAEGTLLRGEAAQIIYRLFAQAGTVNLGAGFDDMDGWFQNGLLYVSSKGLWNTSTSAYPYAVVSKGEVYKIICLGYGLTTDGSLNYTEYATILMNAGYISEISSDLTAAILRWEFCEIVNKITGRDQWVLEDAQGNEITAEDYGFTDLDEADPYYKTMLIATSNFANGYVDLAGRADRDELDKVKKDEE